MVVEWTTEVCRIVLFIPPLLNCIYQSMRVQGVALGRRVGLWPTLGGKIQEGNLFDMVPEKVARRLSPRRKRAAFSLVPFCLLCGKAKEGPARPERWKGLIIDTVRTGYLACLFFWLTYSTRNFFDRGPGRDPAKHTAIPQGNRAHAPMLLVMIANCITAIAISRHIMVKW